MKKYILFNLPVVKSKYNETYRGGPISNNYLMQDMVKAGAKILVITTGNISKIFREKNYIVIQQKQIFKNRLLKILYRQYIHLLFTLGLFRKKNITTLVSTTSTTILTHIISIVFNKKHVIITRAFEHCKYYECKKDIKYFIYRYIYKKSFLVITNSEFMKSIIMNCFRLNNNVEVCFPAITKINFDYIEITKIQKIAFIGSNNNKGTDIIFDIANHFTDKLFYIYGDKNSKDLEKFKNRKNIFLMGYESDHQKIYEDKDLVLVPSLWPEPFGRVPIEAISYGKPVLVSNIGGLPETVNYNKDLIVENNDISKWIEKINLLSSLKKINIQYIEKFDCNSHFLKTKSILKRLNAAI